MATEFIDIVDEKNNLLGIERDKDYAHEHGLWHRTIHIWIYNKKKGLLLQKRTAKRYIFPSLWDITVASHVPNGLDYDTSAIKQVKKDLGFDVTFGDLISLGVTPWQKDFTSNGHNIKNREFRKIYLLDYEGNISELRLNKEFLSEVKFFSLPELKKILRDTERKKALVPHADEYYFLIMAAVEAELKRKK